MYYLSGIISKILDSDELVQNNAHTSEIERIYILQDINILREYENAPDSLEMLNLIKSKTVLLLLLKYVLMDYVYHF